MLPPQAIFDDLVFDVPSWGEARIGNEEVGMWGELRPSRFVARPTPERRSLFDDAQDTFFGDARSLFAPKIVTPPPSPPEARAKLVHTVSWDGFPVRLLYQRRVLETRYVTRSDTERSKLVTT